MASHEQLDEAPGHAALAQAVDQTVISQMARVSRAMVQIYKEQFGRGPERVRTHYAGPDTIVCMLESTLTPVELSLETMDEHQRLRDIRMLFQYTAEDTFRGAVEEITGRRVVAFISGLDTHADVACECPARARRGLTRRPSGLSSPLARASNTSCDLPARRRRSGRLPPRCAARRPAAKSRVPRVSPWRGPGTRHA